MATLSEGFSTWQTDQGEITFQVNYQSQTGNAQSVTIVNPTTYSIKVWAAKGDMLNPVLFTFGPGSSTQPIAGVTANLNSDYWIQVTVLT